MNITEMLGVPVADSAHADGFSEPNCSIPAAPNRHPVPARRRFSWVWAGLAAAVALAIGFSAGAVLATPRAISPSGVPNVAPATPPANVGDFAELFVSLHLTGLNSVADMSPLYGGEPPLAATGTWINHSAAVAVRPAGENLWTVTVAVDALEKVDGAYQTAGIQYFDVSVDSSADHPIAVSAPARAPAPGAAHTSAANPAFTDTVPPDQLAAVAAFFNAHLTGRGELARYVSATARIPTFASPPYQSVSVARATSDSLGRVLTELDAATVHGGHHRLEYVTEMTFESGVWEISSLAPSALDS